MIHKKNESFLFNIECSRNKIQEDDLWLENRIFIISFVILDIEGGGPRIIENGNYAIVNHGDIKKIIDVTEYRIMCIVQCLLFDCLYMMLSSILYFKFKSGYEKIDKSKKICEKQ